MAALKVKDLCKTYVVNKRQNNVIKNVSFEIEQGEMVAVMGPSGSGKSTLLYTVSGMDRPTAGEVTLGDKKITELSDKELAKVRLMDMGFIFQQMHMLKNLTIMDNILLPAFEAKDDKRSRDEIVEYCRELMKKLDIIDIADNDITEVSGGQLQRACICRSLINQPKLIFADEPTGALNRANTCEVLKELNRLNEEGTTLMIVTHDNRVAAQCSRVLYIVDGTIKGEISLGKIREEESIRDRERKVNNWLEELGW